MLSEDVLGLQCAFLLPLECLLNSLQGKAGVLLIPLVAAACTTSQDPGIFSSSPPQLEAHKGVMVHQVITPGRAGSFSVASGIRVSEQELWVTRHQLTWPVLVVDGVPTGYEVVKQGHGDRAEGDWALIKVDPETLVACDDLSYLDHGVRPAEDLEVWFKGYWSETQPTSRAMAMELEISTVPARIKQPPGGIKAAEGLIYVVAPSNDTYHGDSGGAAIAYVNGRQVLLGLYVGLHKYLTLTGLHTRHLCRRWPQDTE